MDKSFWDRVKERAYMNYLNRLNSSLPGDESSDWEGAILDEQVEEKIKEDAYMNYLKYGDNSEFNWEKAKRETLERISFLAFHLHESKYNEKPIDCWKEAEKIYVENF